MSKQTKDEPAEKEYSLNPIELNLLGANQQRAQQGMFDICTFIATERLAYRVTNLTQFRVEDGKLYIGERELTPEEQKAKDEFEAQQSAAAQPGIEAA